MSNYPRYAIYYAPDHGTALDRFGAQHLGYDAWEGVDLSFPPGSDLPSDWLEITQDPRKYGFHATLKPPMPLAPGRREDDLIAACAAFAGIRRSIPVIEPVVDVISGFIAIIPAAPSADLDRLAADCVSAFDPFRAPLTDADRARRNPARLTPRQRDYLERWGYPYVMEEFRFHMTLTGRLDANRASPLDILRDGFRKIGIGRLPVDRIALFRQAGSDQRFRIIGSWPLLAAATTG